ncbi:hypothetical protein [Microbacterium faecale]|nr:hypothetical protein [Microbacterium faecale]
MIRDRDRFDGGTNGGRPDAPPHRPGNTPAGTKPYGGRNRNRDKGEYGENVTDGFMRERGFERVSHRDGPNGIDGIYANRNGDVLIVESKYNSSRLGWASDGAGGRNRQMDDGWLTGHYNNHDVNRIRDALLPDRRLADAVEKLFRNGDVPPGVARVLPDGSVEVTVPRFNPDGSIADAPVFDF